MRMIVAAAAFVALLPFTVSAGPVPQEPDWPRISTRSKKCISCHESVSPGIVADWQTSRHARVTPKEALGKPKDQRRVSSGEIPEDLRETVVGCYECHGLNTDRHQDRFTHLGARINVVVTPDDCRTCHAEEAEQYAGSKKAHAAGNLSLNPLYHQFVETIVGRKQVEDGVLRKRPASDASKAVSCEACHGTEVVVRGTRKVDSDLGELKVPDLAGWPNSGVGRINPDGSRGSCAACHARHSFSIEVARKPHTCAQCHREPDTPAWEVYSESKHGNLYLSRSRDWDWEAVPWVPGRDFRAPTCATCHASLLAKPDGELIARRSHDFGARLWVRIFGLPYSHPQPRHGATHVLKNRDGQPLPTALSGEPAAEGLIDAAEQGRRRATVQAVCTACHATSWSEGHFTRFADVVRETDAMVLESTKLVRRAWERKWADPANLFDESIEHRWIRQWLFYATATRYSAAMGGPDRAAFKGGWWRLTENLREMHEWIRERERSATK